MTSSSDAAVVKKCLKWLYAAQWLWIVVNGSDSLVNNLGSRGNGTPHTFHRSENGEDNEQAKFITRIPS